MPGRRSVVDHALQRRALVASVNAGRTGLFEVCDAGPYLSQGRAPRRTRRRVATE